MSSEPCTACSWTTERQNHCNYQSLLKLFYEAGDRGVWLLGSKLILNDRGASLPTFETSIPVPTVVESWEEGKHTLILMQRIPGEPLSEAWPKLSMDEKERIAKQTVEYLQQLRKLQSDKIQSLGGRPVFSNFLFKDKDPETPHETVPEAARIWLRQCMPSATPYTFTHGDLTNVNVMVENGSLTGIIDWEMSGYFLVWWEYVCTSVPDSEEDREWKALLRKYMPDYSAAREFWLDYYYLCRDPGSERATRFMGKARNEAR
ncbi:kinase-like domain-containing protein [Aspergillus californicus]